MITEITVDDLPALEAGSQLTCSSAGSTHFDGALANIAELLRERGPVRMVGLDELDGDALCVAIGAIGGFGPMLELPPSGDEAVAAVRALEARLGRRVDAIVSLNASGPNAFAPVAAASALGLPLVDCDGMGRVLPLVSQTTYALAGLPIGPLAAVSLAGDVMVLDTSTARSELLLRSAMQAAGGFMLCATYPSTVDELAKCAIRGSTSRVVEAGRLLLGAPDRATLLAGLASVAGARVLGGGRVVELGHATRTVGARQYPAAPTSVVVAEPGPAGRMIRLEGQSEIFLAVVDGVVSAAVPDVLCLLDQREPHIVGLERVAVGNDVDVLVMPADPMWHSGAGLALAGPRAFGFPVEHPREEGAR
ncbi:DUF917 domain-containing protein [Allokutzneria multivorans]|uniref:DUF917 domain-containing protein n=1 Tax=Allokutzneria multivorans TaxID=1142134 RepID=A0ABP7RXP0_9PSEU